MELDRLNGISQYYVKSSLFLVPLMILQNALTREANVMSYYWTSVWHSIKFSTSIYVIIMLCYYGIHGALLSWLFYTTDLSMYVVVDNQKSHSTPVLQARGPTSNNSSTIIHD